MLSYITVFYDYYWKLKLLEYEVSHRLRWMEPNLLLRQTFQIHPYPRGHN